MTGGSPSPAGPAILERMESLLSEANDQNWQQIRDELKASFLQLKRRPQ